MKITADERALLPGKRITFTIQTVGMKRYGMTAEVYQKGSDRDHCTQFNINQTIKTIETAVSDDPANPTVYTLAWDTPDDLTPNDLNDASFKFVVRVKDSYGNVILEVPYYFITVAKNRNRAAQI